jgi:phosphoribosylformimino-5-aminoimidazole carboxamide ribotide isomerase
LELYARLNILGGHSVRLPRGQLDDAIRLDNDPISRARSWAEQGADVIHVVDLDAAARRDYQNRKLIDELIKVTPVPIQVAGGVRSPNEAARLLAAGAHRVVMGTAAIEDQNMVWDLCRDHPGRIVVSIDVRPDEEVAIRGWAMNSGRYLEEVLLGMSDAGVTSFLIAEAGRNALLEPPNTDILSSALSLVDDAVIASGGVRHLDDLRDLLAVRADGKRISGVIVGREVTHGRFTLNQARDVLAEAPAVEADRPATPGFQPSPLVIDAAERYQRLAAELDRAGAHAKTAARRLLAGELGRGNAHGLATMGHMTKAQRMMDDLAVDAADRSTA